MLRSLHIENFVLIDSLDVDFPEGLIIITGQTGAGKSILLGALSLLAGSKADASSISAGAQNCVVEAVFDAADAADALRQILEDNEVDWDEGRLIVRRVVSTTGRSRCFINDSPVPVGLLSELSAHLIDIHSQHESLLLTDKNFQLSVLDRFCGNTEKLASCRESWRKISSLKSEIAALKESVDRLEREKEYNQSQLEQLELAKLKDGELEELESESKMLENAQTIKENLSYVSSLLPDNLREASKSLEKIEKFLPEIATLSERLECARIELEDIADEVVRTDDRIDVSPQRLETVTERLSLLYSLMKKHSCQTVSELIAVKDRYSLSLVDSAKLDERLQDLQKALDTEKNNYANLSSELHAAREAGVAEFAGKVTGSLHYLELEKALFEIELSEASEGPSGSDMISFRFSATGLNPADVSKCASGGELSRIMLSLKALMAAFSGMPTMIFDEIDTGVSGSVADKMGSMICQMGRDMQVFAITHLPQVAAKGDAHYVVSKSVSPDGRAVSSISSVEGKDRVQEIARMLSGATITAEAIANAESLLNAD